MSALNLIIARGFGPEVQQLGTAFGDARNRQQAHNTDLRSAQINQQGALQNQQFDAQDQGFQIEDRRRQDQAAQTQAAQLAALSERVDRLYQMDPNSPEAQQESRAIASELALARGDTSTFSKLMVPQQEGSGFGNVNPGDYTPESLARYAQTRNYRDLVRQYAPTAPVVVNTPGFGVGLVDRFNPNNRTMLTSPEDERAAAAATAQAKGEGTEAAKAASDLPRIQSNARQMLDVLGQLKNAEGLKWVYGPASMAPVIPGTAQADAVALWEQVSGKAFMQAFETLKGGGQITEKEGEKATAAVTRLSNRKMSPSAARVAMDELESIVRDSTARAEKRAGGGQSKSGPRENVINFADLPD